MTRTHPARPWPAILCLTALAALAGACAGEPAEPPPPTFEELLGGLDTDLPEAEATCLQQQCSTSDSAEALASCRTESCYERPDAWTVVPTSIRHDGDTAFVQARLSYTAGGFGPVDVHRTEEAYVGCTLITSTGEEIDLAVTTVFPNDLERPFTLSSDVGPDVQDVIFGVWDRKIEPCDSERMGCREYGFLLDGSLATWPPTVYDDGTRQRIPPSSVKVTVLDGGVGGRFGELKDKAVAAIDEELAVFGAKVGTISTGLADEARGRSLVAYKNDHDRHLARLISTTVATFGATAESRRGKDQESDIVVIIGGDDDVWAQAKASCGTTRNAAYDSCAAQL